MFEDSRDNPEESLDVSSYEVGWLLFSYFTSLMLSLNYFSVNLYCFVILGSLGVGVVEGFPWKPYCILGRLVFTGEIVDGGPREQGKRIIIEAGLGHEYREVFEVVYPRDFQGGVRRVPGTKNDRSQNLPVCTNKCDTLK